MRIPAFAIPKPIAKPKSIATDFVIDKMKKEHSAKSMRMMIEKTMFDLRKMRLTKKPANKAPAA